MENNNEKNDGSTVKNEDATYGTDRRGGNNEDFKKPTNWFGKSVV